MYILTLTHLGYTYAHAELNPIKYKNKKNADGLRTKKKIFPHELSTHVN